MLGGERQVGLPTDVVPKPSYGETFTGAIQKPFLQVNQLHDYIFPGLSSEATRKATQDKISMIDEALSDPRQSFTQRATSVTGELIGSLIPTLPLTFAGSALGAGIAGAVGFGARGVALELGTESAITGYLGTQVPLSQLTKTAASHYLPNVSLGKMATTLAEAYGGYKGMTIPEHFSANYDAINNTVDKAHAIEDWAADNYGFLFGAAPLAAGYVLFKGIRGIIKHRGAIQEAKAIDAEVKRLHESHLETLKANTAREAQASELQEHLQQAEDMGQITPEMHNWYLDYIENPNNPELHRSGLDVLKQLQIPYDRVTGRVWNEVLSRDGVRNLKSALYDQAVTNFSDEENQLLSSFIVHNELDNYISAMRDNPNLLHAIQGMTDVLGERIAKNSKALQEFHYAIERNLPKGLLKRQIFSQNNIYQHLKKIGVYSRRDVPYYVPKDVAYKLKLAEQIKKIESRQTPQYQKKYDKGLHLELKKQLRDIKLMHPADELTSIKDTLLPEGKLLNNYRNRTAFHRLEELSQVWPQAKVLLDRINIEAMNAKQQGLNEILKKFSEMADSTAEALANPDDVKRYLSTRIERAAPITRAAEQSRVKPNVAEIEAIKQETLYSEESKEIMKNTDFEYAKKTYDASEQKYRQFKDNEQALNELIKCALGE